MCRADCRNSLVRRAGKDFENYFNEIYEKIPILLGSNGISTDFSLCHKETPWGYACVLSVPPKVATFYKFYVFHIETLCPHLLYPVLGQLLGSRKLLNGATHREMHSEISSLLGANNFSFRQNVDTHHFMVLPPRSRELGLMFHSLKSTHPEAVHLLLQKSFIRP